MNQTNQLKKMLEDIEKPFMGEHREQNMLRAQVHQALALSRIADAKEENVRLEEVIEGNDEMIVCSAAWHSALKRYTPFANCQTCGEDLNK